MMEAKMCRVRWILLATVMLLMARKNHSQPLEHNSSTKATSNRPRIFSPRMDYDEWTPLGRGDPLKNDPTFDYVPPVLDRVQYWLDTQSSTEASAKRDILVLGVTAKKTSPKIPDHFLKFVDGPKFIRNHHHHHSQQENEDSYRKDFMGSGGAEPPKIIRASNFRNGIGIGTNSLDFRNQNRIQNIPASYYPSPFYNKNSKPYTMMMPPPIQQSDVRQQHQYGMQTEEPPTSMLLNHDENRDTNPVAPRPFHSQSISNANEPSTSSSITLDKSNLVYQSSQTFDHWSATSDNNPSGQSILWNSNDDIKSFDHYGDDHNSAASANHEVVVGQNANIIVDGDNVNNEQVVIGRKEIVSSPFNSSDEDGHNNHLETHKMHIVIANTSSTLSDNVNKNEASKRVTVAVVMPSNYAVHKKGSTISLGNNTSDMTTSTPSSLTRVSPSRQSSTMTTSARIVPRHPLLAPIRNGGQKPVKKLPNTSEFSSTTIKMHDGEFISSMVPPKVSVPSVTSLQHFTTSGMNQRHQNVKQEMSRPLMANTEEIVGNQSPLAIILNSQEMEKTTNSLDSETTLISSTSMTTSAASMTTFPTIKPTTELTFSNPKHPPKSVHTPMYLIIQGHSKVKTYKPTVNKYGIPVEKNLIDVESTTKRFISKFEQFVNDNTRVVSTTRKSVTENNHEVKAKEKRVEQDSLLSLVESGLSAFAAPASSSSSSPPPLFPSLFE